MQTGSAMSGVLPHPVEPTLRTLSNQDLITLTVVLCDLLSGLQETSSRALTQWSCFPQPSQLL